MKKFVIIAVFLVLLAGAAGAGWYFFQPMAADPSPEQPTYSTIEIPTIAVTRIKNSVPAQLFNVQILLLLDSKEKQQRVRAVLPDVIDAVIVELHQLLPRKVVEQSDFEQELIRGRLQKAVDRRIGSGWIHRLTIRNMERIDLK